jgi:hypothetical protein
MNHPERSSFQWSRRSEMRGSCVSPSTSADRPSQIMCMPMWMFMWIEVFMRSSRCGHHGCTICKHTHRSVFIEIILGSNRLWPWQSPDPVCQYVRPLFIVFWSKLHPSQMLILSQFNEFTFRFWEWHSGRNLPISWDIFYVPQNCFTN